METVALPSTEKEDKATAVVIQAETKENADVDVAPPEGEVSKV